MIGWLRIIGELVLVVTCAVLAVLSWQHGIETTWFAASGELPGFTATRYRAPWLTLASALAAIAGIVAVHLVCGLRRKRL